MDLARWDCAARLIQVMERCGIRCCQYNIEDLYGDLNHLEHWVHKLTVASFRGGNNVCSYILLMIHCWWNNICLLFMDAMNH